MDAKEYCSQYKASKRYSCDAMLLGSLIKSASAAGFWPPPSAPYIGHSFQSVASAIETLSLVSLCDDGYHPDGHGVKANLRHEIVKWRARLQGLRLLDFKEKRGAISGFRNWGV